MLAFSVLSAFPVFAQNGPRIGTAATLVKAPGEQELGTLIAGSSVAVNGTDGDWVQVTVEGWMFGRSLATTARDGFDLIVTQRPAENLRQSPGGTLLARIGAGTLLHRVETRSGWTRVRRVAWIARRALARGSASEGATLSPPGADRAEVIQSAPLLASAEGKAIGTLDAGAQAKVLARSGTWTRVQVEGWVRDSNLKAADGAVLVGVSRAEVRANPARYTGQVVEWKLQFIAIQQADELRPEIPAGQAYLLTRGPLPEPGFVYVIVPAEKLEQFRSIPPLQELVIRAQVKSPTTKYLPTPVVELVSLVSGSGS